MSKLAQRFVLCVVLIAVVVTACATPSRASPPPALPPTGSSIPRGCTVLTVSKGGQVFFGGNDDYINPDSYYWVDPGTWSDYGAIWIGKPDNVQQGVNEKGLAYDANGLPRVDTNPHRERIPVAGSRGSYPIQILRQCATVQEVIDWVKAHAWPAYMNDQMQFADASGDAVVISPGPDGELIFTRKPAGDSFLVSTNFNVANPGHGYGQDSRYPTAQRMLGQLLSRERELSVEDVASVMDAVHAAGGSSWTIETLVADLPNGLVYLYYFYQFDKPIVLNVAEEIARPRAPGPLSKLFPPEVQQEAARRYQHMGQMDSRWQQLGKAWVALALASLVLLLLLSIRQARGLAFWLPVVAMLGPLGLLV